VAGRRWFQFHEYTACEWNHCGAPVLHKGMWYCRKHHRVASDAEDMARVAMVEWMEALPPAERRAFWGRVKADPEWYHYWWEPQPRREGRRPIPWGTKRIVAQKHGAQPGQTTVVECPRCNARGEIHWYGKTPRFSGLHIDHIRPVTGRDQRARKPPAPLPALQHQPR
jgi:hypothetical protein